MTEVAEKNRIEDIFISDYYNNLEVITKNDSDHIRQLREKAIQHFRELGLPKKKDELYRFTSITKKLDSLGRLVHQFEQPQMDEPIEEVFRCDITELDTYDLAIVNGWFPRSYPLMQKLPEGGQIGSLAEAIELFPELIEKHYGQYLDTSSDALSAMNTAFSSDGLFAYFPENARMEKPLQTVNIVLPNESMLTSQLVQPRNLIIVEKKRPC